MGGENAHHDFNNFCAEMDSIIIAATPAEKTADYMKAAEIAAYERLQARFNQ